MGLFQWGEFVGAGGGKLPFKIDCDALTDADWQCIAAAAAPKLEPFSLVYSVPRGGDKLADAFCAYRGNFGGALVVDDVWTTGRSMTERAKHLSMPWRGFVLFARGPLPEHVTSFATVNI